MPGPGVKELRQLMLRAEATNGTGVSPRWLWRGPIEDLEDQREITNVEEQIGIFGGSDRTYTAKLLAALEIAETEATFEQIPSLFMMAGLGTSGGGNRTGSAQGASGSTVVFTLPVPGSVAPITYSYTGEVGDNAWAQQITYLLADELKLSFGGGEAMKVSAQLTGRNGTPANALGTFSNIGSLIQVEEILSSAGSFWLSPVGSGWGTGAVTAGNILGGEITFKPTWTRKWPVDAGVLYFSTAVFTGIEITGELTLERQISGTYGAAGSFGQIEQWRSEVPQLLTAIWRGGAIAVGTTYTSKEFALRLPIKWESFESDDMDGNLTAVGKFYSKYNQDTPAANRGTVTIVRLGTSEFDGAN